MMPAAHKHTAQRVLIAPRRMRRWFSNGPTARWVLAAATAFALYRSIPADPDRDLRTAVEQRLRFDYTRRRAPEMQANAARHASDALLAVTDDVLNARVDVDAIAVRGPLFPAPLPQTAVVHVRYHVVNGATTLQAGDRYLAFGRSPTSDWRFAGERSALLYWIAPL